MLRLSISNRGGDTMTNQEKSRENDQFVKDLYYELDKRLASLEDEDNDEVFVERMKMKDLIFPTIIVSLISILFVVTIFSQ